MSPFLVSKNVPPSHDSARAQGAPGQNFGVPLGITPSANVR